jgi:hypothetical protein
MVSLALAQQIQLRDATIGIGNYSLKERVQMSEHAFRGGACE